MRRREPTLPCIVCMPSCTVCCISGMSRAMPCQIFLCCALTIRAAPNVSVPCRAWYQDLGTRIVASRSWHQDLGIKILISRSWYQKKRRAERRSLSKIERRGAGGCRPPARGFAGLEAPQDQQGVWGAAAPPVKTLLWTQNHLEPPSTDHLFITIFREKVKPITTPLDKVFDRPG